MIMTTITHHVKLFTLLLLALFMVSGCMLTKSGDSLRGEAKDQAEMIADWTTGFQLSDTGKPDAVPEVVEEAVPALPPRFKSLNPLDRERVSLSFVQEDAARVLQVLAHAAAFNLVLIEGIGSKTITAEYLDMPVREILDSICRILNVFWSEESGTIYIEQYRNEIIDLDFLGGIRTSNFSVGGDVLGSSSVSGDGGSNSPLNGNFQIEGELGESVTDMYTNFNATLESMVDDGGTFAVNKMTGTLSVRATPQVLNRVRDYVDTLREKYKRQVLIEAKIIEVNLDEKHEMGIDWRTVSGSISNEAVNSTGAVVTLANSVTQDDSFYTLGISSKYSDISGIFRALQQYGSLSVLSNPRLKAMNGQSALISVGQSVAYLQSVQQTSEGSGDDESTEISTEIGSVFDGVLLGVTPVIEKGDIIALHIVPIKSDLIDLDTVEFGSASEPYQITLPRVNLRELSTVARVKSGDIVLLGGLIMEFDDNDSTGLPGLSQIPGLKWLFGMHTKEKSKIELVVALQVHVVSTETEL